MAELFTVDIHTHILPEHIPDFGSRFGYRGFIHLDHHRAGCARMMMDDKFFREVQANCWDPEVRIGECDHQHVHVQVLSTVPVMFSYWAEPRDTLELSVFLNDHIAGIVDKWPTRYLGLGTLPMQDPELAIRELERCRRIGLQGIQVGTHIEGVNLGEQRLFPVFQACQDLDMAVFVHPWDMMGRERMDKYWAPWLVGAGRLLVLTADDATAAGPQRPRRAPCWSGQGDVDRRDAQHVVDAGGHREPGVVAFSTDVAELVPASDGLHPAEGFLDAFADPHRHLMPVVAGGAPVDR